MDDYRREVRHVLVLTLLLNVIVLLIKWVVGVFTGSLSLQADALHSVTDSANNVLALFTSRLSSPQPDREHPYGHQKFEAIGALAIAAFLGTTCFEILRSAIDRIFHPGAHTKIEGPELWFLAIILAINIFVALYEKGVGERLKSTILIADARHTMSDVWVTILVFISLVGVWLSRVWNLPQLQWIDVVLAIPVALLVLHSGWSVLTDNLPWLVDEVAIAPEAIHQTVMSVPGVVNCHDIASRGLLGRQVFIEMHLIVDAEDVPTAHDITEQVERLLEATYAPARVLIHVEPKNYQSEQIARG